MNDNRILSARARIASTAGSWIVPLLTAAALAGCVEIDGDSLVGATGECITPEQYVMEVGVRLPQFGDLPGEIGIRMMLWPFDGPRVDRYVTIRRGQVSETDYLPQPALGSGGGGGTLPRDAFVAGGSDVAGYRLADETYGAASPDGGLVALTARSDSSPVENSGLLLIDRKTPTVNAVDAEAGSDFVGLAWSPDGRYLAAIRRLTLPECSGTEVDASGSAAASIAASSRYFLEVFDRRAAPVAHHLLVEGGSAFVEVVWQ